MVPGYDQSLAEISASDIIDLDSRGLVAEAKLLCENCHNPITKANLGPEYREWVPEFPSVMHLRGYSVSPFDLPAYHSPASILRKKVEFKDEEGHFRNFVLGIGYADSNNSVIKDVAKDNIKTVRQTPDVVTISGLCIGIDVGKTSWLTVGKEIDGVTHVFWAETIRIGANQEDNLFDVVVKRVKQFRAIKVVIDSQPFTDTVLRIQKQFPPGLVWLATYNLDGKKTRTMAVDEKNGVIDANRTKTLNTLVKRLNTGRVWFSNMPEIPTIDAHLQGMKRVDRVSAAGEETSDWVKTGADHYFHSLNYLGMALEQVGSSIGTLWYPPTSITSAFPGRMAELTKAVTRSGYGS